MNNSNKIRTLVTWGVLILICVLTTGLISGLAAPEEVKYSEIVGYFKDEKVTEFTIVGNELTYNVRK